MTEVNCKSHVSSSVCHNKIDHQLATKAIIVAIRVCSIRHSSQGGGQLLMRAGPQLCVINDVHPRPTPLGIGHIL